MSTSGKSHFGECHLRELAKLIYFPNYIQAVPETLDLSPRGNPRTHSTDYDTTA